MSVLNTRKRIAILEKSSPPTTASSVFGKIYEAALHRLATEDVGLLLGMAERFVEGTLDGEEPTERELLAVKPATLPFSRNSSWRGSALWPSLNENILAADK